MLTLTNRLPMKLVVKAALTLMAIGAIAAVINTDWHKAKIALSSPAWLTTEERMEQFGWDGLAQANEFQDGWRVAAIISHIRYRQYRFIPDVIISEIRSIKREIL